MPDLKKRDNFAIFLLQPIIFGLIQLLVTPVGLFGLQVKISANALAEILTCNPNNPLQWISKMVHDFVEIEVD